MNTSACIIAACAANARARRKEEPVHIPTEELYYKVTLRKYYYFKRMVWSTPIEFNESANSYSMRCVDIDTKTTAIASSFSVKEFLCPNGIDEYIKNNLERITSTDEWKARHAQVLQDYCSEVKNQYNIDVDPAYLNYTTEYYWEVK